MRRQLITMATTRIRDGRTASAGPLRPFRSFAYRPMQLLILFELRVTLSWRYFIFWFFYFFFSQQVAIYIEIEKYNSTEHIRMQDMR